MKPKTVLFLAIFAVSCSGGFAQQFASAAGNTLVAPIVRSTLGSSHTESVTSPLPAAASAEKMAFDLLNAQRISRGLPELAWSDQVAAVARHHSENMAKGNFFSHQDLEGQLVDDRAARAGLTDWLAIGENIAFVKGFKDPCQTAVENWMKSNAHRENLLSDRWKESAIGVAVTPDGTYYFTQVFINRK